MSSSTSTTADTRGACIRPSATFVVGIGNEEDENLLGRSSAVGSASPNGISRTARKNTRFRFSWVLVLATCVLQGGIKFAPLPSVEEVVNSIEPNKWENPNRNESSTEPDRNELPIVDSIMYSGEPVILVRLELLYDVVDRFYITESTVTHSGRTKPLYSEVRKDQFRPYEDKITWLVYEASMNLTARDAWTRENLQRKYAVSRIQEDVDLGRLSTPFVIINTDGDELVDPQVLNEMQPGGSWYPQILQRPVHLEMKWFCYNLNWRKVGNWSLPHVLPGEQVLSGKLDLQTHRNHRKAKSSPKIPEAGWHLTYFMSVDEIVRKLESFAHQEYNKPRYKSKEHIRNCIRNGKDLFGRSFWVEKMTPYDPNTLPPALQRFHQSVLGQQNITE